jgi:hypothetical protein
MANIPTNPRRQLKNNLARPLQPHELEFAAWFLEDAGADFQDHSADETFVPATSGALAIAQAIQAEFGDDAPEAEICRLPGDDADWVQFCTSQAMEFFSRRCRELAESDEQQPELDAAELSLMAELLDLAGQEHENVATDVCFDLTLDVTAENRSMFIAAVENYLERAKTQSSDERRVDKQVAEMAMALRAGLLADTPEPTIDIPDYWLMFYLSRRCKDLAIRISPQRPG